MTSVDEYEDSFSRLSHEYSASWKVKELGKLGSKSLKIPAFSPIPSSDVTFHFELWYQQTGSDYKEVSSFKMMFVKSFGLSTPKSMRMNASVTINYYNTYSQLISEPLFKYERNDISVEEMERINFPNEILRSYTYDEDCKRYCSTNHNGYARTILTIVIKCHLVFYNHLNSPTEYFHNERLRKNLKNFANDFTSIYQPSVLSDIEFSIGTESFPAHKSILGAHSPVFLRMICNNFLESKTNIITINDTSPEIFNMFLKYLYTGEIEDKTWDTVRELFVLADKYDVRTLKSECGEITASLLCVENVCEILKMAYDYMDDYLKQEARKFAYKHIAELLSKDEWTHLMKLNPLIGYEVMLNFATPKFPPE